ncbi:PLP-dependent enzyme, histidinol-phosphate/aromatic aminotransferase or cobyric acid decarboxylase [Caldisphaera lagunensis DSM 15908]|uniref:histidinol-phosphate transaminase n=1 Tax=Caldisphaera lagunensis (strain DSM 15908 / JCM 11604 / ANMR 0165 / IC-154) TaxID=1056495 RepID=L0ABP2_CALLD|nr:histidinol-phosphate transaminase [Caldisphaera lagunensis]AFZ70844.1 PLP-dependent enzyme, histidinol-phosphate/aromatic aminotransferase or cobyric acid decarboxylase [Caldisphaera lagunensis DSM 15908]
MIKRNHGGTSNKNVIDFSSPTNPYGPPAISDDILKNCIKNKVYKYYPSYKKLNKALSDYWGIDEDNIIPVNGSDEALTLIPLALKLKKLIIIEPNFGDFDLMSKNLRIRLIRPLIKLDLEELYIDIDEIVKIANKNNSPVLFSRPNNPTGYCMKEKDLEYLSSNINNLLIVDEAFVEISSCNKIKPNENIIIVRSQTKTFSTPGLRLGEVISLNKNILNKIESSLQAWPIDSVTNCFYIKLFKEKEFIKEYLTLSNNLIFKEKEFIMSNLDLTKFKSNTSFILIRHEKIPNPLFKKKLIKRGILIRDASTFFGLDKSYSRISIKTHDENLILLNSIKGVLNEKSY